MWTTVDELCDVVRGGSPRPAGDEKYYNGAIPFLKVADLTKDDGIYVYKADYTIKEAGLKKTRLVNEGTLLLTNSGATLGVPKITTFPTTFNDGIAAFLYMNREVQLYLYWFLKSKTDSLRKIDQGAAQPNLNTDLIKSMPIPLPPLTEQKRIIKEIERWFALTDQVEQGQVELQKTIKQAKSKILDLAIHGKLVPQDPNDEPAIELLKRINPGFTPCDIDHSEKLPNKWCHCSFKDVFIDIASKSYQILQSQIKGSGKYPVISQSANFIEGYSDENNVFQHKRPCILFGDHTRNVKYIDFDFIVGADGVKILCPKVNEKWAYYSIVYASAHIENKGYSRHFSQIVKFGMMLPPLAEQQRIVQKIEDLFSVLDNIQTALEV